MIENETEYLRGVADCRDILPPPLNPSPSYTLGYQSELLRQQWLDAIAHTVQTDRPIITGQRQ